MRAGAFVQRAFDHHAAVEALLSDYRRWGGDDPAGVETADAVIQACRRRGMAANVLHPLACDLDFARAVVENGVEPAVDGALRLPGACGHPAVAAMAEVFGRIHFLNAHCRELGRRLLLQRQLLFCFKVVYRSDEAQEELVSVLVDPLTEEAAPVPGLAGAVDIGLDAGAAWQGYALKRLYRSACGHLERLVTARGRRLELAAQRRLERDMVRLEEYYQALREEALEPLARELHRLEAARNRARLWRAIGMQDDATPVEPHKGNGGQSQAATDRELAALEARVREVLAALAADRERRIQELKEKYTVRAEAALVAAASVWTPRVEVRVKLTGPSRREVTFFYDAIRGRCLDLACDACQAPLTQVYLCTEGELVCPLCFAPCAACGKALCVSCTSQRCHLCDAPLCGSCDTTCPLAGPLAAAGTISLDPRPIRHVCPACRERTCGACAVLAQVLAV
ncbi:MAG TPA: hypothetical protein VIK98_03415 [Limnochordales bacterium]